MYLLNVDTCFTFYVVSDIVVDEEGLLHRLISSTTEQYEKFQMLHAWHTIIVYTVK